MESDILTECPTCSKDISSVSAAGQQQVSHSLLIDSATYESRYYAQYETREALKTALTFCLLQPKRLTLEPIQRRERAMLFSHSVERAMSMLSLTWSKT